MAKTALQKQLDLAAKHINKAAEMLKAEHGQKAYLYFEAEGSVHAMRYDEDDHGNKNSSERQEFIVCSSHCHFDCGAW